MALFKTITALFFAVSIIILGGLFALPMHHGIGVSPLSRAIVHADLGESMQNHASAVMSAGTDVIKAAQSHDTVALRLSFGKYRKAVSNAESDMVNTVEALRLHEIANEHLWLFASLNEFSEHKGQLYSVMDSAALLWISSIETIWESSPSKAMEISEQSIYKLLREIPEEQHNNVVESLEFAGKVHDISEDFVSFDTQKEPATVVISIS